MEPGKIPVVENPQWFPKAPNWVSYSENPYTKRFVVEPEKVLGT